MKSTASVLFALLLTSVVLANIVTHDSVPLKNLKDDVTVIESKWEHSSGLSMSHPTCGSIEAVIDKAGAVTERSVSLGPMKYWDLNGDGGLDARYNTAGHRSDIWLGQTWVQVRNTNDGFSSRTKRATDTKKEYVFRDGRWILR